MNVGIQLVEKASQACTRCRKRKQGCNRALPSCSRCASKLRYCDYGPPLSESRHGQTSRGATNPVVYVTSGPGNRDLTQDGQSELLCSILGEFNTDPSPTPVGFSHQVDAILGEYQVTVHDLLEDYASSIHDWFPILNLGQTRSEDQKNSETSTEAAFSLLWLAILLITKKPCGQTQPIQKTRLYVTIRSSIAALQTRVTPNLVMLQSIALLSLYECAHGMPQIAHLTLSSAVAMAALLDLRADSDENDPLHWKLALLILDRLVVLSTTGHQIPPLCTTTGSLVTYVENRFLARAKTPFPPLEPFTDEKSIAIIRAVLLAGRVLEYVHKSRANPAVDDQEYYQLEDEINNLTDSFIRHTGGHTWSFCGPIIMTLNCMMLLHQERSRKTRAPPGSRCDLALQTSRRLAWDTCRAPIESMTSVAVFSRSSFISMCCGFRAAVAVLESAVEPLPRGEIQALLPALDRFRQRWAVGGEYLRRINCVVAGNEGAGFRT